jgi:hypothetical protein
VKPPSRPLSVSSTDRAVHLARLPGVIYLSMNAGVHSLIESLRIPSMSTRVRTALINLALAHLSGGLTPVMMLHPRPQECLLDMFFEIFRIKLPSWYHAFLDDRRLTGAAAPSMLSNPWSSLTIVGHGL